ncbi:MAG: polyvinylalcohol dehydrogenase [Acidimicrobiia bacterium]|nr:polyvinylalcohol dehydrogenase [Acidimicrobiia bacterium]
MVGMKSASLTCAFLFSSAIAIPADWPQWRGPGRDAISSETGLLKQWPKDGPKLLWRIEGIGDGYATPAVAGSRLLLLSSRGVEDESVQAFSVNDGKLLWSTRLGKVGAPDQQPSYPMARSTPTIDGDRLYALSSGGDLAVLETSTGKIIWKKNLQTDFQGKQGKWAYSESPLIDGDLLIATPGGAEATLVALKKSTGELIWKSAVPGADPAAYASAIVAQAAGRKQYVQFLDKGVVGVDAKTGQFLWRYEKTSTGPANIATPIAHNGYVYSTNARRFGAGLVQLHATAQGLSAEEVYFERDAPNTLGGQVLVNGVLYGTNQKGLAAAGFATGKLKWQSETDGPGSVLYAEGRIYLHTEAGDMILAEATPEAYRELGRFTPPGQPKHLRNREMAWSYPVVANGRLYIRDQGVLWCYDVKDSNPR